MGDASGARLHQVETEQQGHIDRKPPEGDERIMTLHDLLVDHETELIASMRTARTITPEQVARNTAKHDSDDLTPTERATFDTGSMHRLEIR